MPRKKKIDPHFLPYQTRWLDDHSPIKLINKSRQTGYSYVQAYEDVCDAIDGKWDCWFSSSDLGNAAEYMEYCKTFARMFDLVAKDMGYSVIDDEKDIKGYRIVFASGKRITAVSSSPRAIRGKHGKVTLDEFAHHDDQLEMWRAAKPATQWGFPLRIISTPNGKNNLFYLLLKRIQDGHNKHWGYHQLTLKQAVEQGLYDKISQRKTNEKERAAWIKQIEEDCLDYDTFLQEYCCTAIDESTAFLTYALIETLEIENILTGLQSITGEMFVGMDIGRKRHQSVIWVLERLGHVLYTRKRIVLEKTSFPAQREILWDVLNHPRLRRICIDSTGLGMQLAEETRDRFGEQRVEAVNFTANVKEDLAYGLKNRAEDRTIYIPRDPEIREDLHSVRKTVTTAGNIRLDATDDKNHHADNFWALALAVHAAKTDAGPVIIKTGNKFAMPKLLRKFAQKIDYNLY